MSEVHQEHDNQDNKEGLLDYLIGMTPMPKESTSEGLGVLGW